MVNITENIMKDVEQIVAEWLDLDYLRQGDLFVIGCSTSEVAGKHIGTSGSEQIAEQIFNSLTTLKDKTGIQLAFQGCEHINRSLVVERRTLETFNLAEVTVIPVPSAGGSMASHAYKQMEDAVVAEFIQADAGIDIGDTMIGMHIKHVAVPLRLEQKSIGQAHVTAARTRPKLIGGNRAKYPD